MARECEKLMNLFYFAQMLKKILLWALIPLLLFQGCGKGSKNQTVELKNLKFVYEGPLYEGSNMGQYTWKVDLKELLGDQYKEGLKIKGAALKKVDITADQCEDCVGFDAVKSLVMSLSTNNKKVPMKEVALLNPVNQEKDLQTLKIAPELELKDYLNEKEVFIILDADLDQDWDDDFTLSANLTLDLSFD